MIRIVIGLLLGLLIGGGCRYFDIPLPGPPKIVGAMVILSVTLGYVGVDALLSGRAKATGSTVRPPVTAQYCGDPSGYPPSRGRGVILPETVTPGDKGNPHLGKQAEEIVS